MNRRDAENAERENMMYPLALQKAEVADGTPIGISGSLAFIVGPSLPGLA
jgi:hypothetical protein